ncbi:hypothetical protein [Longitalea luteola]|uniref:hypothetical protein n=1 Tax=Longitalea luteola TaxID=2812563 RepID=UPI001A9783DE|nr:hypothetical protein [Longitalea luteola]
MKASVLFILTLLTITAYSQTNLNNYKYVIVPEKFGFSKADDQYGLNTLTKLLLEDKGFTAVIANATLPPEVAANKCNALNAEVVEKKGIFVTNLTLQLKDCQGNIIFKSKEGKSREKEYHTAYNMALRDAFSSLDNVPYKYDGTTFTQPQQPTAAPAVSQTSPANPATPTPAPATVADITGTLYAQPTANGYQLVDTTPKKVLTLLKTSLPDYYIAEGGPAGGLVFKKNEEWVYEYYKDNQLVSQKLQIKF